MNETPLVSIIINSYNGEKFIKKSLESALIQTYKNYEIIFWDNCSTDNTEDIIVNFNKSNRIKYFKSNVHELQYLARSRAVQKAKGKYFAFLDVDDWWDENKLINQINLFKSKDVGIVCSNYWLVNERKKKYKPKKVFNFIPQGYVLNELLKKNFVGMSTLVVSRKAYESLEYGFDINYEIIGDYDLILRLSAKWKLAALQDPHSYYRWHGENLSRKKMNLNNSELLSWIKKMSKNETFYNKPNFIYLISLTYFYYGLILILSNNRWSVLQIFSKIKILSLKFKMLILLVLPTFIINFIRS